MAENQEIAVVLRLVAKEFQDELKKSQGLLGEFGSFINSWKTQLAAGAAALFAIAKSTANYGEELLNTSQKIGVGVEALAGLQYGAKLANLEQAQLVQGLKFLSQNIIEAAAGVADGGSQFQRLGLTVQTATGQLKPTEQVLLEVADRFAGMADGAAKSELAVKLFGKAGIELIPFLNQGKAGIQALQDEARRLGIVMSEQDVQAASEFNDNLNRMMALAKGLTIQIGNELIPAMNSFLELITENVDVPTIFDKIGDAAIIAKDMILGAAAGPERFERYQRYIEGKPVTPEKLGPPKSLMSPRTGGPLPTDEAGMIKAWEARKKAAEQAIKEEAEILKGGFQTQAILAEQDALQLNLGEASRIQLKLDLRRKELDELGALLIREKEVEVAFFNERKKLGFKNAEERKQIETEHAAALHALDSEIRKNQVVRLQAGHQADLERMKLTIHDQAELGRAIVQMTSDQYKLQQSMRQRDLDAEIATRKGLLEQAQTDLASGAQLAARRGAILDAELAKAVGLSKEHIGTIADFTHVTYVDSVHTIVETLKQLPIATELTESQLTAIVTQYTAQRERERLRERDSFLQGWREGLHKYVTDTESMFSLAVDMARQTAQAMQQHLQRFFFDAMEGRVRTLKDLLRGLLDFVKQIVSQVAATLATNALLKFGLSLFSPGGGSAASEPAAVKAPGFHGGEVVRRFVLGGPVLPFTNRDSVPALLTPGEFVISNTGMEALHRLNRGDASGFAGGMPNLTVNVQNSGRTERPDVNFRRELHGMVVDIIWRDVRANGPLRPLFGGAA